jgi:hypothetical protein
MSVINIKIVRIKEDSDRIIFGYGSLDHSAIDGIIMLDKKTDKIWVEKWCAGERIYRVEEYNYEGLFFGGRAMAKIYERYKQGKLEDVFYRIS